MKLELKISVKQQKYTRTADVFKLRQNQKLKGKTK